MKSSLNKTPVILLDCEKRCQEGIIQTFGRKGIPVVVISSETECPAFRSRYAWKKFISPHISNGVEAYIDFLESLDIRGVLVYSDDVSAMVLSQYQGRLKTARFLVNLPELNTVLKVFDKWDCYNLVKSLDIPVVRSRLVENVDDVKEYWDEFRKPVILKGTRLAGGAYEKFDDKGDIEKRFLRIEKQIKAEKNILRKSKIMLQEWAEFDMTDQWCCETVYDRNSNPIGFFTIRKIRSSFNKDGTYSSRLYAGEFKESDELESMTRAILSSMNWKGFAHVEYYYIPKEKKFFFTEVNPRLPGFSYFPTQAGYDMGFYYYADLVGIPYNSPSSFPRSVYFETFRLPGDLSDGIWQIFRGRIKFLSFVRSYLRLFERGTIKVLEPIRLDDPVFTLFSQLKNLKKLFTSILKFFKTSIKHKKI